MYYLYHHHSSFYSTIYQQLDSLISKITIQIGEQVHLNPSLDYIPCSILISTATYVSSSSSPIQSLSSKRLYTLPAYLFIGETQCGILEVHRGNTLYGYVRCLVKLHDVLDISIVDDNKRCLVLIVSMMRDDLMYR